MKLGRLEIQAWGALADTTVDLAHAPLVVLLGPNESGKTTLRDVIETALFGFSPASLERHPFAPWSGADLDARVHARLSDDTDVVVRRQLGRTARGQLDVRGDVVDLRNAPLPWTAELGREGWRHGLAPSAELRVRPADDAHVDLEAAWNAVASGAGRRPSRGLVEQLESEAAALWRPDRRGRPRARELADELRDLTRVRREASRLARETEELASSQRELDRRVERLRGERADLARRLRRSATHGARLARARKRDGLRRQAASLLGDVAPPARVDRVLLRRQRTRARTEAALLDAQRALARLEATTHVASRDRMLARHADELRQLAARARACQDSAETVRRESAHAATWNERVQRLAEAVLAAPLDGPLRRAVRDLPRDELRDALAAHEDAVAAHDHARRELTRLESAACARALHRDDDDESPVAVDDGSTRQRLSDLDGLILLERGAARQPPAEVALILAALACVALAASAAAVPGWLAASLPAVAAFCGLCAVSLHLWSRLASRRVAALRTRLELADRDAVEARLELTEALADTRSRERRVEAAEEHASALAAARVAVDTTGDALQRRRRAVEHLLSAVPLAEHVVRGRDLAHDLSGLADALARLDEHDGRARALRAEREELAAHLAALDLGPDESSDDDPLSHAERLARAVDGACQSVVQADALRPDLLAAKDDAARTRSEHERSVRELDALERLLASLDPDGDLDAGLARARKAQHLQRRADALQRELDEDLDGPDLGELEQELARDGLRLPGTPEHARWQQRLDALEAELGDAEQRRAQGMARLGSHADAPDLADLDGRMAALEDEQREVRREHDRLRLLAAVIREAGERWRATTREPILARASHWATRLTDGRWRELRLQETPRGTRLLAVAGHEDTARPVAAPLSRGTRTQLRLALRLALAESLEGEQPLPLVLDEAFASWDDRRAGLGAELLARVGRRHQVVVLTCRARVAERLAELADAHVVTLGEPP